MNRNGQCYSGSLIPNLTSVTDILTMPFDFLVEQMKLTPSVMRDLTQPPILDDLLADAKAFRFKSK